MKQALWIAALILGLASCRPPTAELKEVYKDGKGTDTATVDHGLLDKVLRAHVKDGVVDYTGLHANPKDLDGYLEVLQRTDFAALSRDEKLALLINAYNACTLKLIVDHWPLKSIKDIPTGARWKAKRWRIGSLTLSLDEIEHSYLRPKFKEPRIHFAVNCASIGCPPLRSEAYRSKDLEQQLQAAATFMHNDARWFELDAKAGTLKLTALYDWFAGDFEQVAGSVLEHAARFNTELAALIKSGKRPDVEFLAYDWNLNGK